MKKFTLIALSTIFLTIFSQKSEAQTFDVNACIAEVYGDGFEEFLPTDAYNWLENCISRCSVILMADLDDTELKSLNDVPLNEKYGASLSYDETYIEGQFNPLKYLLNFHINKTQYYRIGTSEYVLKIEAN